MKAVEELKQARGLAQRLIEGEEVLGELFETALWLLDEYEGLEARDRAFLEEVRFAFMAAEEKAVTAATRRKKVTALRPMAEEFVQRGASR